MEVIFCVQGAISPLLANIYLHPIDRLMAAKGSRMVRYADDFVILTSGAKEAHRALKDVERLLRGRGLAFNHDKTRIVAPGEDVTFLGYSIRASRAEGFGIRPAVAAAALQQRVGNAVLG